MRLNWHNKFVSGSTQAVANVLSRSLANGMTVCVEVGWPACKPTTQGYLWSRAKYNSTIVVVCQSDFAWTRHKISSRLKYFRLMRWIICFFRKSAAWSHKDFKTKGLANNLIYGLTCVMTRLLTDGAIIWLIFSCWRCSTCRTPSETANMKPNILSFRMIGSLWKRYVTVHLEETFLWFIIFEKSHTFNF